MVRGVVIYLLIEPLLETVAVPEAQSGAGDRAGDFLHLSALWFRLRLPNKKITRWSVRSAHSHLPSGAKCGCSGSLGNVLPFCHDTIRCHLTSDSVSAPPSSPPRSTPKPKNRPPSPAAPKSRPLSPLVPAAGSKTPTGKKTPPPQTSGAKTRPKRAQTPARVQPQAVAAVNVEKELDLQQPASPEEKKGECL